MNAQIPELANQLETLLGSYEEAKIAVAQAPDRDRVDFENQANVISIEIEEFFAADSVVAAIDELRDKRTEEFELIGELFAEGKLTDKEIDERLEAIEANPEYRLLALAGELGKFSLKNVEIDEVPEEADEQIEIKPKIEITIPDDSDLELEEIELIKGLEIDVIEEEFEYETEAETELESVYTEADDEPEELYVDTEVEAETGTDPLFVEVTEEVEPTEIVEENDANTEETEKPVEIETDEITADSAAVLIDSIIDNSETVHNLGIKPPNPILVKALHKRQMLSDKDVKDIAEEKPEVIAKFFEKFEDDDLLLSLVSSIEQSDEMYDFVDYVMELKSHRNWRALKDILSAKAEDTDADIQPKAEVVEITKPKILTETESEVIEQEPIWAPPLKNAVSEALEILEADKAIFSGQIKLDEFQSMTNVDINAYQTAYDLSKAGLIEEDEVVNVHDKAAAPEITLTDAVLMMVYKTSQGLLGESSKATQAKAVTIVEEAIEAYLSAKEESTNIGQEQVGQLALAA